jgi:hypothetical protein
LSTLRSAGTWLGTAAGTWYILVYYDSAPQSGEYTIEFETTELKLLSVSPPSLGEAAPMELTLTGVGFAKPIQVELAAAGGATYSADTVEVDSFTQITAAFAAGAVPAGVYTVRVSQSGGGSDELPGAFEVVAGGEAHLETNLILPATVGYSAPATIYVEYRNTGTVAMLAPLLTLTASQNDREAAILTLDRTRLSQGFWTSAMPEGFVNSVQFVASGENPGVLQPGESRRVPVYYVGWQLPWNFSYPPIQWNLGVLSADDTTAVDWSELKAGMRPSYVRDDAWDAVWANFTAQAGSTWGDYMAMLDRNAVYLNRLGQRVEGIRYLLSLAFRQADALSPIPHLASGDDALVQAPGLPIAFHRAFAQPISRRYELGPLGRGRQPRDLDLRRAGQSHGQD